MKRLITLSIRIADRVTEGGSRVKLHRSEGDALTAGTLVFAFLAMLLAFGALIVAAQAWSHSNDTKDPVAKLAAGGLLGTPVKVTLEEFTLTPHPNEVKAGQVRFSVDNVGSITHEMVLVRAPSAASLPTVATATADRAVSDVNEEAIPESDKIGETGDVATRTSTTKNFKLTRGTYVLFCNIDEHNPDGTVLNHFQHGMSDTIEVK